jgi:Domain of unknown function (DUF4411)
MADAIQFKYVIDTSSIIHWYVETYDPEILPNLPQRIDDLVTSERLVAPEAVRGEIRPGDDLHIWAKQQTQLFVEENEDVQREVARLMKKHHNAKKPGKGISGADPFVIAMAKTLGVGWIVICNEHEGSQENRKIPYVCKAEGIPCIDFKELMLREKWKFT